MGSSKKSRDKSKDERKKKKHRSRSRSRDRDAKKRHKHKKKSHRREQTSRSRSPLSEISDASEENGRLTGGMMMGTPPPPPRISETAPPVALDFTAGEEGELSDEEAAPQRGQKRRLEREEHRGQQKRRNDREDPEDKSQNNGQQQDGAGLSISIEETNRIREKLGLKPLQVEDKNPKPPNESEEGNVPSGDNPTKIIEDAHEFYHKPAANLRDKLQVEKLREKIAVQREKRKQKQKLKKVKTLADSDSEDDALSWINKNRKLTKERLEAEKKAKQLEELDAQFGVGDLVEEEIAKDNRQAYGRGNLSGIKVQHHHTRFDDGNTILTLADSEVLANDEDTLVNVNLIDDERAEKNVELRSKKDTTEYEAAEVDEFGNMVQRDVLSKYDEEMQGPKKNSFRIGAKGQAMLDDDSLAQLGERERKMARLKKLQSLTVERGNQLATEYLTQEEAVSFKKVKKVRKKKKKMLTADDLQPLVDDGENHGSRNRRVGGRGEEGEGEERGKIKSLSQLMEEEEEEGNKMEVDYSASGDYEGINDDEDMQRALAVSRKAKLAQQKQMKVKELKEMLKVVDDEEEVTARVSLTELLPGNDGQLMTLNKTDEFCRTLGDIPTYGLSGNRAKEEQQSKLNAAAAAAAAHEAEMREEEQQPSTGTWEEVGIDDTRVEIGESEANPILDEEPDTSVGVANALKLAMKKGYLETEDNTKKSMAGLQHLRAINYSIDDKAGEDDRRGRRGGDDRYSGPTTEFKEKDGYKPAILLEYVDDEGRKLCPKEAFRYLSHKFHGRGSGKNKTEKRKKKFDEESAMKSMSSSDTPLQTLERQMEKQKALGSSYLLLSGNKHQEAAGADTKITK